MMKELIALSIDTTIKRAELIVSSELVDDRDDERGEGRLLWARRY